MHTSTAAKYRILDLSKALGHRTGELPKSLGSQKQGANWSLVIVNNGLPNTRTAEITRPSNPQITGNIGKPDPLTAGNTR